jgi:hypothetical protein
MGFVEEQFKKSNTKVCVRLFQIKQIGISF